MCISLCTVGITWYIQAITGAVIDNEMKKSAGDVKGAMTKIQTVKVRKNISFSEEDYEVLFKLSVKKRVKIVSLIMNGINHTYLNKKTKQA